MTLEQKAQEVAQAAWLIVAFEYAAGRGDRDKCVPLIAKLVRAELRKIAK